MKRSDLIIGSQYHAKLNADAVRKAARDWAPYVQRGGKCARPIVTIEAIGVERDVTVTDHNGWRDGTSMSHTHKSNDGILVSWADDGCNLRAGSAIVTSRSIIWPVA